PRSPTCAPTGRRRAASATPAPPRPAPPWSTLFWPPPAGGWWPTPPVPSVPTALEDRPWAHSTSSAARPLSRTGPRKFNLTSRVASVHYNERPLRTQPGSAAARTLKEVPDLHVEGVRDLDKGAKGRRLLAVEEVG